MSVARASPSRTEMRSRPARLALRRTRDADQMPVDRRPVDQPGKLRQRRRRPRLQPRNQILLTDPTPCHPRLRHPRTASNQTPPRRRKHSRAHVSLSQRMDARAVQWSEPNLGGPVTLPKPAIRAQVAPPWTGRALANSGSRGGPLIAHGAQGRNRTSDTVIFSHVLYQLSYLGPRREGGVIAGSVGPVHSAPPGSGASSVSTR